MEKGAPPKGKSTETGRDHAPMKEGREYQEGAKERLGKSTEERGQRERRRPDRRTD